MEINKKNVLFLLVFIEFIVCILIANSFYQKIKYDKKIDSVEVAKINKDNLIFPKEEDFQYYFLLEPNKTIKEHSGWENYKEHTYTYNVDGLNDQFDYAVQKPSDTFRIITLGDSFTYGHFVNTEDSWPEQLEEIFKIKSTGLCGYSKVEIINLGMHAFDVPYITKRYKDLGAKYNPDLIIWFESKSGFSRTNEIAFPIQQNCQNKYIGPEIDPADTYLPCMAQAYNKIEEKYSDLEIDNYIISYLENFFSTVDVKKVIFFSFEPSMFNKRENQSLNRWKQSINNLNFIQIVPDIYRLKKILPDDYHPNIEGHKTIAETIFNYLTENEADFCLEVAN